MSTRQVRKKVSCAACVVLKCRQYNGGPVARGKAPFPCSFLEIEISSFRKDLLSFILGHKLNLVSGENSSLKEMLSL